MLKILLLICLTGVLAGFLRWRRTPRPVFFGAMFCSVWIYVIAFLVAEGTMEQINPEMWSGYIPYLAGTIPVAPFLAWFLTGQKGAKK
jgi:hypothetical protein